MDASKLNKYGFSLLYLLVILFSQYPAFSQDQSFLELPLSQSVDGQITAGTSQSWRFSAAAGAMLSFRVRAISDDFDPIIEIRDTDDILFVQNDDFAPATSPDSLIEGFTFPDMGTYTVTISGFGDSAGRYELTMLPGYAIIAAQEGFSNGADWRKADTESPLIISNPDTLLKLEIEGIQQSGIAFQPAMNNYGDFYAQVALVDISGRNGWLVGMTLRQQKNGDHYALIFNDQGFWRFESVINGETTIARDWSTHPTIVPGTLSYTMGVLANDTSFEVFYNGQFIGSVSDNSIRDAGQIGVTTRTIDALGSQTTATFDDLIITVPENVDGSGIFPDQILVGSGDDVVQALRRQRMIPVGGEMRLTIPESFATDIDPGVSRFTVGQNLTFTDFVMGTSLSWEILGEGIGGCGLVFRETDDDQYTLAYIDNSGGIGMAQRLDNAFETSIFTEVVDRIPPPYHIVLIANRNQLHYYVNGQYIGMIDSEAVVGSIGNAVVNFDPVNTSCQFNDLWLWSLDQ